VSLLDLLKGNYERHVADWTPRRPGASSWHNDRATNAAGIKVTTETALNSGTAMACTRAISETLASLPAAVIEQVSPTERRKARENSMWALLHDQPNPEMDSMIWYEVNCNRVVNRGNAVSVIESNGRGIPRALWPVHNSRFEIFRRRSPQIANGRFYPGDVYYRIWPDETERHFDVPSEEVLNVVSWDTEDGLIGRGVVNRARQEIGLDIAEQEFTASMFKNGTLPLGLVKHPWIDDPEQRENLRADLNSVNSGRDNWNKLGILWDKDADWIKLGYSPADVESIASRTFTAKALCRYYNVPPAIVQIFDDYKFSTIEAMLKHFIMLTIRPYAVRFERAINSQILNSLPDPSLFLEFALEGLLRGDPETQAKTNQIYRTMGAMNVDEIRQRDLGMNPLPNGLGQVLLAPLNHGPLDRIAAGENMRNSSGGGSTSNAGGDGAETAVPHFDKAWLAALLQHVKNGSKAPTPAPTDKPKSPPPPNTGTEFAVRIVEHTFAKIIANEVNSIRSRASKGSKGFMGRVDEYHKNARGLWIGDLTVACEGLSDSFEDMAIGLVDRHVAESRERLLTACECSPAEFSDSIEACLSDWQDRKPHIEEMAI